jgi:type IV secretory pathway VirB10-like protein
MRKKSDPKLLAEELRKFKLLSEYTFYTGDSKLEEEDTADADLEPADDALEPDEADAAVNDIGKELGVDNAEEAPADDANAAPAEPPASATPPPAPQPANDDVEVDVTSLVKGSKEAEDAANHASKNTVELMAKFADLENKVAQMGAVSQKIDALEKEIVMRNPTPVEKLEMRSLDSYPYNIKLNDYWQDKEGPYDVMGDKKDEYVLTQDDVNSTYSDATIKQTFDAKPENLYEEEDI